MKCYEVVGYVGNAEYLCPCCADEAGLDLGTAQPVFAGDEDVDTEYCGHCHTKLLE